MFSTTKTLIDRILLKMYSVYVGLMVGAEAYREAGKDREAAEQKNTAKKDGRYQQDA